MRLLLDTHVFLWWLADDPRLGKSGTAALADADAKVYVSAASIWEMAIKASIGKLKLPKLPTNRGSATLIERSGFLELPVTAKHADQVRLLPMHHADPFDRILIAQAQVEEMHLVTADHQIPAYDVACFELRG